MEAISFEYVPQSGMAALRFLDSSMGFPSVAVIMCVRMFMPTLDMVI